jgi:hypothetical protein
MATPPKETNKNIRLKLVKLDVGGVYYTTTEQTLTKDVHSMLAVMFSGER